jgi:hypothetical protein
MKAIFLCGIACVLYSFTSVSAQQQFPDNSEAIFNRAMNEINPRYTTWIRTTAVQVNEKNMSEAEVKQVTATQWAVLGSMNGQDIEALCFLVLMQAAKTAQEDLKAIMAHVKSINDQKSKLRGALATLNDKNQKVTRLRLDSLKLLSAQTQILQKQNNPGKTQIVRTTNLDSLKFVRTTVPVSQSEIEAAKNKTKNDLDSMSEMGEMESLRLQMAMDRMSKMMSTLSNLLKKISSTGQNITQNLK